MVIRRMRKGSVIALWVDGVIPDRYRLTRELGSGWSPRAPYEQASYTRSPVVELSEDLSTNRTVNDAMYCDLVKRKLREKSKRQSDSTLSGLVMCYLIPPMTRPSLSKLAAELREGLYRAGAIELLRFGPLSGLGVKRKVRYRQLVACIDSQDQQMASVFLSTLTETFFRHCKYYPIRYGDVYDFEVQLVLDLVYRTCSEGEVNKASIANWFENRGYQATVLWPAVPSS